MNEDLDFVLEPPERRIGMGSVLYELGKIATDVANTKALLEQAGGRAITELEA